MEFNADIMLLQSWLDCEEKAKAEEVIFMAVQKYQNLIKRKNFTIGNAHPTTLKYPNLAIDKGRQRQ